MDVFQSIDKIIPVIIVLEYLLALDSSDNDMMQCIRSIYAGLSGHENSLSSLANYVNFIILSTSPVLPVPCASPDRAVPVISKKGKASLRYALYQAALIASTRNTGFIAYFTEKLKGREKEPGIKTKMRVKLAVKMLVIAWTLMKKKELFDPKYLNHE